MAVTGAAWIAAGFVHGVLITESINITGLYSREWQPETQAPFEQVLFDLHGGTDGKNRLKRSPIAKHYGREAYFSGSQLET